jgi:hypothetical protein
MKYLRPYKPHGNAIEGYVFDEGGHDYLVCELSSFNGVPRFGTYTDFSRVTNNIFGIGSKNVEQSGWRRLPYDGL